MADSPRTDASLDARERYTLAALRYAVNDEAASYLAIMRLFTTGMSGFLSDQSAAEVAERLVEVGLALDQDTVEARLSYLVEHGNLARSPRETEARSVREYLSNRSRYQLTQRGELVHRQVEQLLAHTEQAREVSSEMLPGILEGLELLSSWATSSAVDVEPREVAARISTLFAQFELLVSSTRQFYSYLSHVLTRFDLGRDEFLMFKGALVDYLQRFVDEVSRHMPQLAEVLREIEPHVSALCARAGEGQRLIGVDGSVARRAAGLNPDDWVSLHVWFVGAPGRRCDADNVRSLATDAMRSLLVNLRRIAAGADRQQSRYADLVELARWFDGSSDEGAHELWAAAFGLYSARHLGFAADDDADPVPATASWWQTPVAHVPVNLRRYGDRRSGGRSGARVDYSEAKRSRIADRCRAHERQQEALRELARHCGTLEAVHLSDAARQALLDLYSRALSGHGRPLTGGAVARHAAPVDAQRIVLSVTEAPGETTVVTSPQGKLSFTGLRLQLDTDDVAEQSWRAEA
jgi:uncharacterized protein (TIGR02677 family)